MARKIKAGYIDIDGSTSGQVLTSNGTVVYWANTSSGGFTNGQSISVNNFVITGAVSANGSNGVSGQVLATNGSAVYWTADQGANAITANTLTANQVTITTGTLSVGNSSVNTDIGNNYISVGNTVSVVNIYSTYIYIGNSSSNSFMNASFFSATANNALYLNGNSASDLRTYTDNKAANAYSNAIAYSGNAAQAYSNAIVFASNASNINTGTLAEARLPYRMDQNVRTTDNPTFANLTLTGSLSISGNVNVVGANTLSIVDNFIYLNSNNTTDNEDIGIVANYNDGTYRHTGIFRDATDGVWKIFDSYLPEPDANVNIDTSNNSFQLANFKANTLFLGNTSTSWFTANSSRTILSGNVTISGALLANGVAGTNGYVLTTNGSSVYWAAVTVASSNLTGNSQTFTSNGSANITLSTSINPADAIVTLNGLTLIPTTDYTISGTTLSFTTIPLSGDSIEVRTFAGPVSGGGTSTAGEVISSFLLMGA